MTAETVVKTFLNHQLANSDGQKNMTAADLDRLKATGVDLSKLSAGLAAVLAGKDIDTGGNAAEHNALIIVPIVLELMDKGLQTYDAYRLAKAIEAGDTDEATNIAAEIALGAATDGFTGNVVAIKIASAVEKFGLAALGAKIVGKFGDETAGVVSKNLADPNSIRFTQDSVKNSFQDKRTLQSLVDDLKSGKVTANDIPPIRVFEKDGKIYSLDNRRLKAFQEAGAPIRTVPATPQEIANEAWKMTTKTDGLTIKVRDGGL